MKNKLFLSISLGLIMGSMVQAKSIPERPYVVGPELYEVHTDAQLFTTHLFVNGRLIKLSHSEDKGGYSNKAYLNAFLKPGDNEIKVVFDSPLLEKVRGTDKEIDFIRNMYAHVVINTGKLSTRAFSDSSYELDELIAAPHPNVNILKNVLLRRFKVKQLADEVSITHTINIPSKKAFEVQPQSCDVELDSFSGFTGKLLLNGVPFLDVTTNGHGQILTDESNLIVIGENTFESYVIDLLDNKPSSAKLEITCDLKSAIAAAGIAKEYQYYDYGTFMRSFDLPLVEIKFDKPGKYKTNFYYSE